MRYQFQFQAPLELPFCRHFEPVYYADITRVHQHPRRQIPLYLRVDAMKLRVAVGMVRAIAGLLASLSAVGPVAQKLCRFLMTGRILLPKQLSAQNSSTVASRSARPGAWLTLRAAVRRSVSIPNGENSWLCRRGLFEIVVGEYTKRPKPRPSEVEPFENRLRSALQFTQHGVPLFRFREYRVLCCLPHNSRTVCPRS